MSGDLTGCREWSSDELAVGESVVAFEAPMTFDLRANIAFRATNSVEVFVMGNNLLDQNIYDFAHYYRNGIGFMVGAKIDF